MKTFVTALALAILLVLAGCDNRVSKEPQPVRAVQTVKRQVIRMKPQDSLVNLAVSWAEAYSKENPAVWVDVSGNGSVGPGTLQSLVKGYFDAVLAFPIAKPE